MKKPKLNLRKLRRFSPAGNEMKYIIGNRTKFQMVQTTVAFVIATSLNEEPNVANIIEMRLYLSYMIHAPNSNPARDVNSIQDHPVNEMKNAATLCIVILA
jgi:hypothetical protein